MKRSLPFLAILLVSGFSLYAYSPLVSPDPDDFFNVRDGAWFPDDLPGWGTDIREDVIAKYPPSEYTVIESEP